jgi:hypothetical protein
MEENECGRHPPGRPVNATDGLEGEPKPVGKEGKVRSGQERDPVDLCEGARSPTGVREGRDSEAGPR